MKSIIVLTIKSKIEKISEKYKRRNMNKNLKKAEDLLSTGPNSTAGGEVMIRFDSGEIEEFHSHDTEIDNTRNVIKKNCSDGTIWFDGDKIEAVWIHQSTVPSE